MHSCRLRDQARVEPGKQAGGACGIPLGIGQVSEDPGHQLGKRVAEGVSLEHPDRGLAGLARQRDRQVQIQRQAMSAITDAIHHFGVQLRIPAAARRGFQVPHDVSVGQIAHQMLTGVTVGSGP